MESVQENIEKTIEIIGACEDVEESDIFDQNENENISREINPLENVGNPRSFLEIPGIKKIQTHETSSKLFLTEMTIK